MRKFLVALSLLLICNLSFGANLVLKDVVVKDSVLRTSYTDWTQDADCVGAWRFNQDTQDTAIDTSGNDEHGDVTSTPGMTTGKEGLCWEYDGINDVIDCGDIAAIDTATELTVSAWVYHDDLNDDDAILNKGFDDGNLDGWLMWRDNGTSFSGRTDAYSFAVWDNDDGDSVRIETAQNSSPNQTWTHVVATLKLADATGLRFYINGVEDANSPVDASSISSIQADDNSVYVGWTPYNPSPLPFDGKIDEVILFSRALTAQEITELYKYGIK